MKENINSKKGFTLIEMVVVLALIGIVASVAYSLFFYGYQSFYTQEKQADIQSNTRIVTDYIVNTSRNATKIKIIPTVNAQKQKDKTSYEGYTFIYLEGDTAFCHLDDGSEIEIGSNISVIKFTKIDDSTLGVYVEATDSYNSTVNLNLPNIALDDDISLEINNKNPDNNAIRFIAP